VTSSEKKPSNWERLKGQSVRRSVSLAFGAESRPDRCGLYQLIAESPDALFPAGRAGHVTPLCATAIDAHVTPVTEICTDPVIPTLPAVFHGFRVHACSN